MPAAAVLARSMPRMSVKATNPFPSGKEKGWRGKARQTGERPASNSDAKQGREFGEQTHTFPDTIASTAKKRPGFN